MVTFKKISKPNKKSVSIEEMVLFSRQKFQNNYLLAVLLVDLFDNFGIDIRSKLGERKNEKISCIINRCIGAFCM